MAGTIVGEGKLKCWGTIKKGGLAGKECRRAVLVKDPVSGWGIPCDRCPDFHPLRKILSDLVESGEMSEEEILAAISKKKGEERVVKKTEISLPRNIGGKPKQALELVSRFDEAKKKIFAELFKKYFKGAFTRGGRCYNGQMEGNAYKILFIGYGKPLKVVMSAFESERYEFMICGTAFWSDPSCAPTKFSWVHITTRKEMVLFAQRAKKFFDDLGIEVSLEIKL